MLLRTFFRTRGIHQPQIAQPMPTPAATPTGIDAWGRTEMWIADRGIPYLVTFLNKRYWEEPPAPADTMYPVKVNGHKPDNADITRAGLAALTERYRERG